MSSPHRSLLRFLLRPASLLLACAVALAAPLRAADDAPPFALHDGDRVVFYGDSITQAGGYCSFVEGYVRTRFPSWNLRFYNGGVGGDTVRGGAAGGIDERLERDVVALKPTVVTIMLGMNDGGYHASDEATRTAFRDGYRAIVQRLQRELPGVRLYLILPSPYDDYSHAPGFPGGYDAALRLMGDDVAAIARDTHAGVVDFGRDLIAGLSQLAPINLELAQQLLPDRVHPSPAGHLVMGAALLRAWHAPGLVSRVELDAGAPAVTTSARTRIADLARASGGLAWTQTDEALMLPVNFDDASTRLAELAGAGLEALNRQILQVRGLTAARYALRIDDRDVGNFTAAELAAGVNLARLDTPIRWQAYGVRWGAEDSRDLQLVARRNDHEARSGAGDPALRAAAAALMAADDARQAVRSVQPTAHHFVLTPQP